MPAMPTATATISRITQPSVIARIALPQRHAEAERRAQQELRHARDLAEALRRDAQPGIALIARHALERVVVAADMHVGDDGLAHLVSFVVPCR